VKIPSLEKRILGLCGQAVETNDAAELEKILSELRKALHEQHVKAKAMVAERTKRVTSDRD
jgi:hypothetical protein